MGHLQFKKGVTKETPVKKSVKMDPASRRELWISLKKEPNFIKWSKSSKEWFEQEIYNTLLNILMATVENNINNYP